MAKRTLRKRGPTIKSTLRFLLDDVIAMGPGKAELLEAIAETGSISAAAKHLDMSYRRAWMLVDAMNRCFRKPLIEATTGGSHGGGCKLTPAGSEVLQRYRAMEVRAASSIRKDAEAFSRLLRPRPARRAD